MEEDRTPELVTMCAVFDLINIFCEHEREMSDQLMTGLDIIVKSPEFAIGIAIMKAAEPKLMDNLAIWLRAAYESMKDDE